MINISALRQSLTTLRSEAGLTPEEVADNLGMHKRSWLRYETGETKTMDVTLLDRLAELCGKTLPDVLATDGIIIGSVRDNAIGIANVAYSQKEMNLHHGVGSDAQQLIEDVASLRGAVESLNGVIERLQKILEVEREERSQS